MRFDEIPHPVVERARAGDEDAIEEFCLMVQPDAYAVLMSLLRNVDDADDALQESLIRVIRFLPRLRDIPSLPGWLMRLLVNQAAATRKARPRAVADVYAIDTSSIDPAQSSMASPPVSPRRAAQSSEISTLVNEAVRQLPERQRTALVLFEMEMLSIHAVAEAMEITDGAVKFHLHEARKNLRQALQDSGVADANLSHGGHHD